MTKKQIIILLGIMAIAVGLPFFLLLDLEKTNGVQPSSLKATPSNHIAVSPVDHKPLKATNRQKLKPLKTANKNGSSALKKEDHHQQITEFISNIFDQPFVEESDRTDIKKYFSHTLVNKHTIKIFKQLQGQFTTPDNDLNTHYQEVREYLLSCLDEEKVENLLAMYKKFTEYEMELANNEVLLNWPKPTNSDEAMALINEIHKRRQDAFGPETADKLWGHELKTQAFVLQRHEIISNDNTNGAEKERQLADLKARIWDGNENDFPTSSPFAQYQEKLRIYKDDLAKMTPAERKEKISTFRHEILSPEAVKRLDNVEKEMIEDERRYRENHP